MIVPGNQHSISRGDIGKNPLLIIDKLQDAGFKAYLVGGSVRDLLAGITPKDFDIATNARPEKIRKLFHNCRLIGRRFRLAHVFFGREIIEVATFRGYHSGKSHPDSRHSASGMIIRDNVYGSMEDDAWRRDFTINALYYDPANSSLIDYTGGIEDIKKKTIRILGDPQSRYTEDPVRMLRALKFAAKLNFTLEQEASEKIYSMQGLLKHVSPVRLFEEVVKLFYCGQASRAFTLFRDYKLFELLFPQTEAVLASENNGIFMKFIRESCNNTDKRINQGLSLNPAFLFSVLLWPALSCEIKRLKEKKYKPSIALEKAANQIITEQLKTVSIPKRFIVMIREVWWLQRFLERHHPKQIHDTFTHPRFRAAYDFLLLRVQAGETQVSSAAMWWTDFQAKNEK